MVQSVRRLALGTVQFGLAYGITNKVGKVSADEVGQILSVAADAGIDTLDTAAAYGDSEAVLGGQTALGRHFRIITKLPAVQGESIGEAELAALASAIGASRRRLGRPSLDTLLLHSPTDLFLPGGEAILKLLEAGKSSGLIGKIGVSVYKPEELERILAIVTPDLVQLPANLLDQRFQQSGMIDRLKRLGTEIHARSLFLQGSLLAAQPPKPLLAAASIFQRVRAFLDQAALTQLQGCLAYGLSVEGFDRLVIGVTSVAELREILAAIASLPEQLPDFSPLAIADEEILNPAQWKKQ